MKDNKKIIIKTSCEHHTFGLLIDLIAEEKAKEKDNRDLEAIERYKELLGQGEKVSHWCYYWRMELNKSGCGNCSEYLNIDEVE